MKYTVTYTRNGGKWLHENVEAESEQEAREEFDRRLKATFSFNSHIFTGSGNTGMRLTLDKNEIEKEIKKFEIITVSRII